MNLLKKILLPIIISISTSVVFAEKFSEVTTDLFVSGNSANENMEAVNFFTCLMANARSDLFIGKDYKAQVYENKCEVADSSASDSSKGVGSSSSASGAVTANSGAADAAATSGSANQILETVNKVSTKDESGAFNVKTWASIEGPVGSPELPVYVNTNQRSGITSTNPYGNFDMTFTAVMAEANADMGIGAGGFPVNQGYLNVAGEKIEFMENQFMQYDSRISVNITNEGANKDDAKGVYSDSAGFYSTGSGASTEMNAHRFEYAFLVDDSEKFYCEKLISGTKIPYDMSTYANATSTGGSVQLGTEVAMTSSELSTALSNAGKNQDTKCFSLATEGTTARKTHIWEYGLFSDNGADGERYKGDTSKKEPFNIKATIDGVVERGFAAEWGVHIDNRSLTSSKVTGATWTNMNDASDTNNYSLASNFLRIEKETSSYINLDSLDKIKIRLYTDWGGCNYNASCSSYWGDKFTALGFSFDWDGADNDLTTVDDNAYYEYEGYWDKANQKFTFDTAVSWQKSGNTGAENTKTITAISFTPAQWATQMGSYNGMGVWSDETRKSYEITAGAMSDPDASGSLSRSNAIKIENRETVDINSLADGFSLLCIELCFVGNALNTPFVEELTAMQDCDNNDCTAVRSSPYNTAVGDHFTATDYAQPTTDGRIDNFYGTGSHYYFSAGDEFSHRSGASRTVFYDTENTDYEVYTVNGGYLYDGATNNTANRITFNNTVFTRVATLAGGSTYSGQSFDQLMNSSDIKVKSPTYDSNRTWDYERAAWGLRSGRMVENTSANRDLLECDKDPSTDAYYKFGDNKDHPKVTVRSGISATDKRLCVDKLESGAVTTTYRVILETRTNYSITSGGSAVAFRQPQILFYPTDQIDSAEELTISGISEADKNKMIILEFDGRSLHGIPGYVYDTKTGQALGQNVREWNASYRYIDKFRIPNGHFVYTNKDLTGTKYQVKAISGDQFLVGISTPTSVTAASFSGLTRDILPATSNFKNLGPNGGTDYIGAKPADNTLEGSGAVQVLHGVAQ
tara:strand:+ start:616 stop:3714 length:3099 start_codon:yes stop_codon:yes gene_type:complete